MINRYHFYGMRIVLALGFSLVLFACLMFVGRRNAAANTVTIYAYSDMLSNEVFQDFTRKTGIKVNVKHFEAIEEITTKLLFAGEEDIDIVAPTDAMVEIFRKNKLMQPLDKKCLPNAQSLDGRLMEKYYDPDNTYSIPFVWSPVAIGYDTRVLKMVPENIGWDLIFGIKQKDGTFFSPSHKYGPAIDRVCLGEDPWETMFLAADYLYGSVQDITPEKLNSIINLLRQQRAWLECYTNNLKYFLISEVCHAVVMPGAYMVMMQEEYPWVDFVVPKTGGTIYIGNLIIPKKAKNKELAHKVIDYLISVEGGLACFEEHAYNPANQRAYTHLPERVKNHPFLFPNDELFSKLKIFHNQVPMNDVERYWYQIKL